MPPPRNFSRRSNSKIQPSHFPKRITPMRAALPGRLSYPPKGLFPESWGKQGATEMRGQHGSKIALPNTLLPSLPILSRRRHIICCRYGLALPPEIPRRTAKRRFRKACPKAHCDTQKTPRRKAGRFASRNQHRGRISSSSRTGGRFSNRILSRLATQRAAISSKPF